MTNPTPQRPTKEQEMIRLPDIIDADFWNLYPLAAPYTLLPAEKLYNFYCAIRYVVEQEIPGDIVECGVWFGGAVMLAGELLSQLGDRRNVFLYDTFQGFTERSDCDITLAGKEAATHRFSSIRGQVEKNLAMTQFSNYHVVEGDILETLKPDSHVGISILRLDTDTYRTTLHELTTSYRALSRGGVLIIDDYGHCQGARKATEEFFASRKRPFFQRPDYSSRTGIKI
jgi:hypothetical protein